MTSVGIASVQLRPRLRQASYASSHDLLDAKLTHVKTFCDSVSITSCWPITSQYMMAKVTSGRRGSPFENSTDSTFRRVSATVKRVDEMKSAQMLDA